MSEDWLDPAPQQNLAAAPAALINLPPTFSERVALAEQCWSRLSLPQKTFLTALRENRFNARAANRAVHGRNYTNTAHTRWMSDSSDYTTVLRIWRARAGESALDRDRLLARHDDIVETLLTPQPVLFQGVPVRDTRDPTGFAILEEVDAGGAARANETLMKAAGMLRDKADVEVNVGLVGPGLEISVMQSNGDKTSLTPRSVPVPTLPEPTEAEFEPIEDWLSEP